MQITPVVQTLSLIVCFSGLALAVHPKVPKWLGNMGMHAAIGAALALVLILIT